MSYSTKRLRLAAPIALGSLQNSSCPVQWNLCCMCHVKSTEKLVCPAENPNKKYINAGYLSLGKNLEDFETLGLLPRNLCNTVLKAEGNFESTFIKNKAKWHKSCSLKYNSTKLDAAKVTAQKSEETDASSSMSSISTRSYMKSVDTLSNVCFLCTGNSTGNNSLRKVCTLKRDLKVRKSATALADTSLLATLSNGDLCAREGKYHLKCLSNLYNRYRAHSTIRTADNNEGNLYSAMVFGELVDYIQGKLEIKDADYVFKLSDLASMYDKRLAQLLGKEVEKGHSTRLKEKILMHFPTFRAHKQGNGVCSFARKCGNSRQRNI